MRAFWRRKQPVPVDGPTKWIVCCNVDESNLHAEAINNPVLLPGETVYDTEREAWEETLVLAVDGRADAWLAFKKSHHEVERIESKLKALTTGDTA